MTTTQTQAGKKRDAGMTFPWNDPFLLEGQLNEEERMIRDAAAAFAADRLLPRVEEAYLNEENRSGDFP